MNNGKLPGFKTAAYYRSFQTTIKRSLDAIKTRKEGERDADTKRKRR